DPPPDARSQGTASPARGAHAASQGRRAMVLRRRDEGAGSHFRPGLGQPAEHSSGAQVVENRNDSTLGVPRDPHTSFRANPGQVPRAGRTNSCGQRGKFDTEKYMMKGKA